MPFSLNQIFNKQQNVAETSKHNEETLKAGETFVEYGKRLCGISNGNVSHLPIYFSKVIESEKNRFARDENLQASEREKIQSQIEKKKAEINVLENGLDDVAGKINDINEEIQNKKGEIAVLQTDNGQNNRDAKVKFYFGAVIIALLAVYLFIFYSSTFYSAFFGSDTVEGVSDAMFNTQAIAKAFGMGFGPMIFVCTAPVIFMALGYALHYFSAQKNAGKYFKVAGCIIITFILIVYWPIVLQRNAMILKQ